MAWVRATSMEGLGDEGLEAVVGSLADPDAGVGEVDDVERREIEGLDGPITVGAVIEVLAIASVLAPALPGQRCVFPDLHSVDEGAARVVAVGAHGRRAIVQVGGRRPSPPENDIHAVAALGWSEGDAVRTWDVAKHRIQVDLFVLVAEGSHFMNPLLEPFPACDLDDVLDDDELVAMVAGEAYNVAHGGA